MLAIICQLLTFFFFDSIQILLARKDVTVDQSLCSSWSVKFPYLPFHLSLLELTGVTIPVWRMEFEMEVSRILFFRSVLSFESVIILVFPFCLWVRCTIYIAAYIKRRGKKKQCIMHLSGEQRYRKKKKRKKEKKTGYLTFVRGLKFYVML